MFDSAVEAELLDVNPVAAIKTPRLREVRKEREILTDEECAQYMASPIADLEVRMLGLASRCEAACGPAISIGGNGRRSTPTTSRSASSRGRRQARRRSRRFYRSPPIQALATKPGQRTDLGKIAEGTKSGPNPLDPLYFETESTLPVDFHSFRRAFSTALAEAGINVSGR